MNMSKESPLCIKISDHWGLMLTIVLVPSLNVFFEYKYTIRSGNGRMKNIKIIFLFVVGANLPDDDLQKYLAR